MLRVSFSKIEIKLSSVFSCHISPGLNVLSLSAYSVAVLLSSHAYSVAVAYTAFEMTQIMHIIAFLQAATLETGNSTKTQFRDIDFHLFSCHYSLYFICMTPQNSLKIMSRILDIRIFDIYTSNYLILMIHI